MVCLVISLHNISVGGISVAVSTMAISIASMTIAMSVSITILGLVLLAVTVAVKPVINSIVVLVLSHGGDSVAGVVVEVADGASTSMSIVAMCQVSSMVA